MLSDIQGGSLKTKYIRFLIFNFNVTEISNQKINIFFDLSVKRNPQNSQLQIFDNK